MDSWCATSWVCRCWLRSKAGRDHSPPLASSFLDVKTLEFENKTKFHRLTMVVIKRHLILNMKSLHWRHLHLEIGQNFTDRQWWFDRETFQYEDEISPIDDGGLSLLCIRIRFGRQVASFNPKVWSRVAGSTGGSGTHCAWRMHLMP